MSLLSSFSFGGVPAKAYFRVESWVNQLCIIGQV
jgi:hypothetical protein